MSIGLALNNALSGLRATSRQTEVASENLANALTPSYGRQVANISNTILGAQGAGVQITGVQRSMAPDITAARRMADADAAQGDALAQGLERLAQAIGEADDSDGLFNQVQRLEAALRHLGDTPESTPRQEDAAYAAAAVADRFNQAAADVAKVRQQSDREIGQTVTALNEKLENIVKLNRQIRVATASGRDAAGLVDQRERLIDEVGVQIPVRTYLNDDNSVRITTESGLSLVDSKAATLEFTTTPVITADLEYDPSGGALSGLVLNGTDITPTSGSIHALKSGALAGQFAIRDDAAQKINDQLDQIAADLITRFEDPSVDPSLSAGDPGLFVDAGGPLVASDIRGLASRIGLNALVDPGVGGDPSRLRDGLMSATSGPATDATLPNAMLDALTDLRNASATPGLGGSLSIAGQLSGIVEIAGIARSSNEARLAGLQSARETIAGAEADKIGVNSDQELQSLILFEQAYAANARVIQTAQRMLDQLLEI